MWAEVKSVYNHVQLKSFPPSPSPPTQKSLTSAAVQQLRFAQLCHPHRRSSKPMPSPRQLCEGICKHLKSEYNVILNHNRLGMLFWFNTKPTVFCSRSSRIYCIPKVRWDLCGINKRVRSRKRSQTVWREVWGKFFYPQNNPGYLFQNSSFCY